MIDMNCIQSLRRLCIYRDELKDLKSKEMYGMDRNHVYWAFIMSFVRNLFFPPPHVSLSQKKGKLVI